MATRPAGHTSVFSHPNKFSCARKRYPAWEVAGLDEGVSCAASNGLLLAITLVVGRAEAC